MMLITIFERYTAPFIELLDLSSWAVDAKVASIDDSDNSVYVCRCFVQSVFKIVSLYDFF